MPAPKKLQIAVIVQSSRGFGRNALSGIAQHARIHRNWSIYHDERVNLDPVPEWLQTWNGDGLVAGIETEALANFVRTRGMPAVDLHGQIGIDGVPIIRPDQSAATRLAYDHLREVGFQRIGFCGFAGIVYSSDRENAYRESALADGMGINVINSRYPHEMSTSHIEADGFLEQDSLIQWLSALEKPCGIIACNDLRGAQVLNACRSAGISVPDEVGVIGMDNDDCVCAMCDPPLTSVDLNAAYIGFQAAETINQLVQGHSIEVRDRLVEPTGVITRQSTSLLVLQDKDVSTAMRYIREHASAGIGVNDVVTQVHLSRSTLERRFKREVGRSIKAEINRHRLSHVKELLSTTDYSMNRIASLVGFSTAEYMIAFFRKSIGMTPGEYRKSHTA